VPPLPTVSGGDLPSVELSGNGVEACKTSRLDISNDRQDVGRKLSPLGLAGHAHALDGAGGVGLAQSLSARLGGCQIAFERVLYSFISAKAVLRSHNARAARSSNAGADGVVGRHTNHTDVSEPRTGFPSPLVDVCAQGWQTPASHL
jgi:hypothetical protein